MWPVKRSYGEYFVMDRNVDQFALDINLVYVEGKLITDHSVVYKNCQEARA